MDENTYQTRLKFGVLVAALREDIGLTQNKLADNSAIELRIIQDIEQGRRIDLHKDNVLLKLATGLKLTTLEIQQFMFAASGAFEHNILREKNTYASKQFNSEETLTDLRKLITEVRYPAYIVDSFCDVLFANRMVIKFLNIPPKLITEAGDKKIIDGRNIMRVLFHPESTYRNDVGDDWEHQALINIRFFRRVSLRYRGNPYYLKLKKQLDKYEAFYDYWEETVHKKTSDEFMSYAAYKLKYSNELTLKYFVVETTLGVTPYGELHMNTYTPIGDETARIFDKMYKTIGSGCEQFSPFPDEDKWKSENV